MQRVFVRFERQVTAAHPKGFWRTTYQDHSLKRELGRASRFGHPDLVRKLFDRSAETRDLEAQNLLEMGIRDGRGGFWMRLNPDEFDRQCGAARQRG